MITFHADPRIAEQQMQAVHGGAVDMFRGLQVTPLKTAAPGGDFFSAQLAVMVEKQV